MQGAGPSARYAHTLSLVANRFLVAMGGNDGKSTLGDAWALDTSEKPYQWRKITDAGDMPCPRCGQHRSWQSGRSSGRSSALSCMTYTYQERACKAQLGCPRTVTTHHRESSQARQFGRACLLHYGVVLLTVDVPRTLSYVMHACMQDVRNRSSPL